MFAPVRSVKAQLERAWGTWRDHELYGRNFSLPQSMIAARTPPVLANGAAAKVQASQGLYQRVNRQNG